MRKVVAQTQAAFLVLLLGLERTKKTAPYFWSYYSLNGPKIWLPRPDSTKNKVLRMKLHPSALIMPRIAKPIVVKWCVVVARVPF